MRNVLTLLCLMGILYAAQGQLIYYTNFNDVSTWTRDPVANILHTNEYPSNFVGGPPFASGGYHIQFCDGQNNGLITLTSPAISTEGYSDIRVAFGARITPSWNNNASMRLMYSVDGQSTWDTVISQILLPDPTNRWYLVTFNYLGENLNDQPEVFFRFQYNANGNNNCDNKHFLLDDFAVGINFNLPVELTAFEASPVPGKRWVDLRWSTASEKDNAYFEIERSSDEGRQYEVIGTVPGAGTTALPQFYTFEDRSAPCGTPIYRLRQVDTDQAYSYSPARAVRLYCSGAQLQPTLVQDRLQVVWDEDTDLADARWQLIGPTGRVVSEGAFAEEAAGSYAIYVAGLPEGWYFLRVQSDRYTETLPFIKQ